MKPLGLWVLSVRGDCTATPTPSSTTLPFDDLTPIPLVCLYHPCGSSGIFLCLQPCLFEILGIFDSKSTLFC
ncbi:hypothetical protein [Helicobacter mustelae]|uniref:hypothetical protein n=1 Tax=Helicobacter mustelae TaxID=217 RepID=UPI0011C07880|nr:hypothetical protein [Helicobacter mustelae]